MIDPVTLAVLKGRLEQIADEMDATLFRSAFNPIIAEAHDASHGIYHAETGDTLVQGKSGLPIFVGTMSFAVRAVMGKAARDGDLADGDVYIFNDPYAGGKGGVPFISPHLKKLRPFLGKGDFAPGAFGHALIDELQPADLSIEKVTFSAFYQSRLDWTLRHAGIETLVFGGIVTNGGVASTLRDAHVRDFHNIVLQDGCAAFSDEAHEATVASLSSIAEVASCADIIGYLNAT